MVESTIDKIKDITVERQIRKLAGIIDEQNDTISQYGDATADIEVLKTSDAKQNADITNLNNTVAPIPTQIQSLIDTDANQATQINNLKQSIATDKLATEAAITELQSKDASQDGTLANHATLIQGITESLVSDVQIMPGTTTGDIKVRLERESVVAIDSNNYNLGLPVSAEIIQGTGPSMFKIQITMSTGVKVVSNDFVFTTEAIGNDVYISSFTFKAGNQSGYLSADIGLNNGVTIEANNFLVPTDPNVTSAIADLQTRLTTVENSGVSDISGLKTTVGEHTNEINTLNSDVADLMTDKADVNNSSQSITAGTINATNINKNGVSVATVNDIPAVPDISGKADLNNSSQTIIAGTINATNINKNSVAVATVNDIPDISGKVNISQGIENAGKTLIVGEDGNVTLKIVSSSVFVKNLVTTGSFVPSKTQGSYALNTRPVTPSPKLVDNSKGIVLMGNVYNVSFTASTKSTSYDYVLDDFNTIAENILKTIFGVEDLSTLPYATYRFIVSSGNTAYVYYPNESLYNAIILTVNESGANITTDVNTSFVGKSSGCTWVVTSISIE